MENKIMKNAKLYQKIFGVLMLSSLVACGGNDDDNPNLGINDPRYAGFASACGDSYAYANLPYKTTVRGQDPSGAVIELLIYGDGTGNIGAVGQLTIPDLSRLGAGLYGSHSSCVSSQGLTGQMQISGTDDEIRINLQGNSLSLTPYTGYDAYTPIIRNQYLVGDFVMNINGRQVKLMF